MLLFLTHCLLVCLNLHPFVRAHLKGALGPKGTSSLLGMHPTLWLYLFLRSLYFLYPLFMLINFMFSFIYFNFSTNSFQVFLSHTQLAFIIAFLHIFCISFFWISYTLFSLCLLEIQQFWQTFYILVNFLSSCVGLVRCVVRFDGIFSDYSAVFCAYFVAF